jgi:hypothetical protein
MWQNTKRVFLDSTERVLSAAAQLLPSVLAMLLIFALTVGLAVATQSAVRRLCNRLAVDRRLREWGVAPPAGAWASPTRLLTRISFWTVLVLGLFLGLSVLDTPAASAVSMRLLEYAPRLLVSFAMFAVAVGIARVVERNVLIGAVNMGMQSARLLALGARWLVVLLGVAIALDHAGVGASVVPLAFGILFGGIVFALALAVGLGAKDLVARSLQRHFPEPGSPEGPPGPPSPPEREERGGIHHV